MSNRGLLVVACLAMLSATVVSGCAGSPPPTIPPIQLPPSLTLIPDNWNGGSLTIDIDAAQNAANLTPGELTYKVFDQNGTVMFSGAAGTGQAVGGVTVTVAFQDVSNTGKVNAGDRFLITVSTGDSSPVTGGTFEAYAGGENIASVSI